MELKPGYKQTDVGVIPEEWAVKSLGEIGEPLIGLTYKPSNVKSDGLLVLRSSNVADGALRFDDNVFVDMDVPNKIIARKGDILICVRNGSRDLIGKCAKIDDRAEGMTFGAFMAVLRTPFHDFVYYQFQSEVIQRQIHEHLGATINQITNRSLRSFRIPFPDDESEQCVIAGALGDVDALLRALTQLIAKKRDLKQAAMQQLLTGQTRLPGFGRAWEAKRLAEVVLDGPRNGYSGRSGPEARGTPTLRLTATTSGYLILNEETVKRLAETIEPGSDLFLRHGDLLIQRSNTPDLVGTAALFDGPSDTYVYPDLMMRLRFREESTARWIWSYANSQDGRRFFLSASAGSTGSMPKISGGMLREMVVPFPPLAEQTAIAAVLSDMAAAIAALEQRLAKTRALKQGMMQELLNGRTRLV